MKNLDILFYQPQITWLIGNLLEAKPFDLRMHDFKMHFFYVLEKKKRKEKLLANSGRKLF